MFCLKDNQCLFSLLRFFDKLFDVISIEDSFWLCKNTALTRLRAYCTKIYTVLQILSPTKQLVKRISKEPLINYVHMISNSIFIIKWAHEIKTPNNTSCFPQFSKFEQLKQKTNFYSSGPEQFSFSSHFSVCQLKRTS